MLQKHKTKCLGVSDSLECIKLIAHNATSFLFLSIGNTWFNYTSGGKACHYILCYYSWGKHSLLKQAMEIVNKATVRVSGWWFSEFCQSFHRERSARVPSSVAVNVGPGPESCATHLPAWVVYGDPQEYEAWGTDVPKLRSLRLNSQQQLQLQLQLQQALCSGHYPQG